MSAPKNVIDMRPGKGFTTSQSNEHLRRMADKESAKKAQWNYDPSREYLNFEIGKGGVVKEVDKTKSIPQRIKENLEARGIKDPNISLINQGKNPYYRTVANFILGGNREVMRNLAFGNQKVNWEHGADNSDLKRMPEIKAWAKDAYAFMCKKYGEQNIAAFVVHLDETNPHCHCTVLPITKKNKFSFFGVFLKGNNTKDALSEYMDSLHTEYADEVGLKYGMERGDSIKKTGAVHRTTEEYRRKLWKDAQEKEEEVRENTKTIEQQNSTITNQRGIIASLSREIKHSAARLKALATMIKNFETHKADLEQEIKKLNRDLAAGKISKEEADRKLSLINADFLDTTVGSIFDGSVIKNMAESAAEICSIASSLYMGYLDAATRIAQSSGGGGGPGTGWGKRDDENDMDFRRRCFGMAMKMMKPGRQQRLKR